VSSLTSLSKLSALRWWTSSRFRSAFAMSRSAFSMSRWRVWASLAASTDAFWYMPETDFRSAARRSLPSIFPTFVLTRTVSSATECIPAMATALLEGVLWGRVRFLGALPELDHQHVGGPPLPLVPPATLALGHVAH